MATRPIKSLMLVNTTATKPVLMKLGINMIPENTGNGIAPYLDTPLKGLIQKWLYKLAYLCGSGGSLAIFTNYIDLIKLFVSLGYNSLEDVLARGLDPSKVLHGRADKDYGFGAFESDMEVCKFLGIGYLAVLNPSRPVLDGRVKTPKVDYDFARINAQIDYILSVSQANGVPIIAWKIGEESQASANKDIFPTLDSFKVVVKSVAAYIHSKDATAQIIADANPSTDPTCRFDDRASGQTMNKAMAAMEFVNILRDYCQFFGLNYTDFLAKCAEFDAQCDTFFNVNFPGKAMELAQQQLKMGSPYENTVTQMLTVGELFMRAIQQGKQGRKILFTLSQTNGLISGTRNDTHPMLYGMSLLQDALEGEICDVTFQLITGSENLFALAVLKDDIMQIFIRNKGVADIMIPITRIVDDANIPGGYHVNTIVESYYGALNAATALHYEQTTPGDNAICKGQGFTKITATLKHVS